MEFIVWKSWPLTIGVPAGIVSDSPRTADAVILGMWGLALIVFILLVLEQGICSLRMSILSSLG